MMEVKRREPIAVVEYVLRRLERQAIDIGSHPVLIHEGLEALNRLREENVRLRQRVEELERENTLLHVDLQAAEANLARCVEAASDVAEGACSFKDSRVSYEEWQINVGSMERLRAAIAGEATSRGWLIESTLSHGGGPRWWQGKQPGTEEQWTGSHTAAIRFARREDAEACRLTLGDAHVSKVTEHVWL